MVSCVTQKENIGFECKHHKDYYPLFIQLNDIREGDILLCSQCVSMNDSNDQQIKQLQSIEILIKSEDITILPKWPPLEHQGILRQIQKVLTEGQENKNIQQNKVESYFDKLQCEFNKQICNVKKQMLQMCDILPELEESLYNQYNQIAEKDRLKGILMDTNIGYDEANLKLKEIILEKEKQKKENEESLLGIFNSYVTTANQLDEKIPISIMNEIIQLIDKINFFPKAGLNDTESISNHNNNKNVSEGILNLIQNKSNFCKEEFIEQIKERFNKWSFLFEDMDLTQIHLERHTNPICFDGLTHKDLINLEELVDNLKNKEKNILLTPQVMFLTDLINSSTNSLTKEFQEYISQKMKVLTPFLSDCDLETMYNSQLLKTNNPMKLTFHVINLYNSSIYIMPNSEIKFTKTSRMQHDYTWVSALSDQYLEKNKRYEIIFEIDFKNKKFFGFLAGLKLQGGEENLEDENLLFFEDEDGINRDYGIGQIKKGTIHALTLKKQLQLTVCLSKGILEIGDYPSLENVIELNGRKKKELQAETLYKIGFGIYRESDEILIKSVSEILI